MPTIKDVAQKAGVTVTTVSRVLNDRGYISGETREKVRQAIAELNYQPNEIARSLYRRRSNLIGLIIPTVAHPFFAELANYIEQFAYEYGYKILLCNSHMDRTKEKEYVSMLKRHQVDGIIMGSHTLEVDEYINLKLPFVTLDRCISEQIPFVASDNYTGGQLATLHLIGKECQKIAFIGGNINLNLLANKRYEAFIVEVNQKNVEHITMQMDTNVFETTQYEKMITRLFKEHPDIDGIFASSDVLGAIVVQEAYRLRKRIPEELKVVGYDDVQMARMVIPRLTTIRQPLMEISRLALELILKQINGEKVQMRNILSVELIERQTT